MDIERRTVDVELRAVDDGGAIEGYAAVFNSESRDLGGFREIILPGAFARAVREDDVRSLWNHDPKYVLGRTKSRTLHLREDERGLYTEVDPPDTQWARDFRESIRRGDVDQMSFQFKVPKGGDRWERREGVPYRLVSEIQLFDVSPVTFPAYEATSVSTRALAMAAELDSANELNQANDDAADAGAGDAADTADGAALEARRARARLRLELAAKQISGDD